MKYELRYLISLLTIGLLSVTSAFAGKESSGGADSKVVTNAWFLATSPQTQIQACYTVSPKFGVSSEAVAKVVKQAFQTWDNYIISKRIMGKTPTPEYPLPTRELSLHAECKGNEDLRLYFGTQNDEVRKALTDFNKPYAISKRTNDADALWGNGFIYVANPSDILAYSNVWNEGNHLLGILLHEVGHTLGNGHLDGTIMDANIGENLRISNTEYRMGQIDIERELRICVECGTNYEGQLSSGNTFTADGALSTLLAKPVTGVKSVNFKKSEVFRDANGHRAKDYNLPKGDLVFDLEGTQYIYHVKTISMISTSESHVPLFKVPQSYSSSYGRVFIGELTKPDGSTVPVIVNLNSNRAAFEILLMDQQKYPQKLFRSSFVREM